MTTDPERRKIYKERAECIRLKEEQGNKVTKSPIVDKAAYRQAMIALAKAYNVPVKKLNEVMDNLGLEEHKNVYNVEVTATQTFFVQVEADSEQDAICIVNELGTYDIVSYNASTDDWHAKTTGYVQVQL